MTLYVFGDIMAKCAEWRRNGGEIVKNTDDQLKSFGKLYESIKNLRDNDEFMINQKQMEKLFEVTEFFNKIAGESGGKVEPLKLVPNEEHGGVTATFIVFDMYGERLEEFKKIVQHLSALTIDSTTDNEVCISITVPNVFEPRI